MASKKPLLVKIPLAFSLTKSIRDDFTGDNRAVGRIVGIFSYPCILAISSIISTYLKRSTLNEGGIILHVTSSPLPRAVVLKAMPNLFKQSSTSFFFTLIPRSLLILASLVLIVAGLCGRGYLSMVPYIISPPASSCII